MSRQVRRLLCRCAPLITNVPSLQQSLFATPAAPLPLRAAWQAGQQYSSWQHLQHNTFSSSASAGNAGSGDGISSGNNSVTTGGDPLGNQFERMLEMMMSNPTVMEMMMSRMPPHMRQPEVLKAMMANPEVRARMAALAQEKGLASIIQGVDLNKVSQGMSATLQAGIDPSRLIERFQQSPTLAKAMENPRVLAALMDMASNGADALKKYEGDKDIVEAAMEAGEILQQLHTEGSTGGGCGSQASSTDSSSITSSSTGGSSMAAMEEQLGVKPQELMQRLMSRPDLLAKVQDPEVQAALMDVSKSPWKIIKYTFNKKVMSALKDMKDVVQAGKS